MTRLGIERHNSAYSKLCNGLLGSNYIGLLDARNYGLGHIYYLTKKGATLLANDQKLDFNSLNFCITEPKLSSQTLYHRTYAIDCQIELTTTCAINDVDLLFYDRDIEALGNARRDNNLTRKTRIAIQNRKHIEPDAIFMLDTPKGKKLYCLEFENKDYTSKSFLKIEKHVEATNLKSASKKYGHDKGHRTLWIYKNPATMKSIMEKTKISIDIGNWFLFKSYDEVRTETKLINSIYESTDSKDFFEGWKTAGGDVVDMF